MGIPIPTLSKRFTAAMSWDMKKNISKAWKLEQALSKTGCFCWQWRFWMLSNPISQALSFPSSWCCYHLVLISLSLGPSSLVFSPLQCQVGQPSPVCVYMEVPQDLSSVIPDHLWGLIPFWPRNFQAILGTPCYVLIVKNKPVTTRSIRRYFPSGNAELLWGNRLVGVLWAPQRSIGLLWKRSCLTPVAKTSYPSGTDFPHHEDPRSAPTYSQAASGPPSLYLPAPPHSDVIYLLHHVFTNLDQPASTVRVMFFFQCIQHYQADPPSSTTQSDGWWMPFSCPGL